MNRYPTEDELIYIRTFDDMMNFTKLMSYIREIWEYADDGYWTKRGRMYFISTGGWSGNEDIISAMEFNFKFWSLCWFSSKRGGHYRFHIPRIKPPKQPMGTLAQFSKKLS